MGRFVLTRDMCPIHYVRRKGEDASVAFICPLPLGFREVVSANAQQIYDEVAAIVRSVNAKALKLEEPFQNILVEYQDRDEQGQKDVLKLMQIRDFNFDYRGLYSVAVHAAEGDIYLDSRNENLTVCDFIVDGFREFFEPNISWQCHNVDYYWQALLTREVVVEYFNTLQILKERAESK